MTALWGLLASITSPRTAIAVRGGILILPTPLLLPRHAAARTPQRVTNVMRDDSELL